MCIPLTVATTANTLEILINPPATYSLEFSMTSIRIMWMVYKYTPIQSIEGYEGRSNRWKRESLEIWIVWPRRLQLDSWPDGRTSACSFRTRRTLVLRLVQLSLKRGGNAITSGAVRKCHPIWKVGYIGKASRNSSVYFNIYGSSNQSTRLCAFNV